VEYVKVSLKLLSSGVDGEVELSLWNNEDDGMKTMQVKELENKKLIIELQKGEGGLEFGFCKEK